VVLKIKIGDGDMPSKSEAQRRLMQAAAHDKAFAKKVDVPQKVAREFEAADRKVQVVVKPRRGQRR
jgi:hypothetical protein